MSSQIWAKSNQSKFPAGMGRGPTLAEKLLADESYLGREGYFSSKMCLGGGGAHL